MTTGARSCYSTFSGIAQDSRNRGEGLRGPPLVRNPFEFLIVPGFVRAEALSALNRDFPLIDDPGNVSPDGLRSGPASRRCSASWEAATSRRASAPSSASTSRAPRL
jgi:hypothetical protein